MTQSLAAFSVVRRFYPSMHPSSRAYIVRLLFELPDHRPLNTWACLEI